MDKQINFMLTMGIIYRLYNERTKSEEILNKGYAYCENVGTFIDPYQCNITKSRFKFELASIYLD